MMDNRKIYHITPGEGGRDIATTQKQLVFLLASVRVKGGGAVFVHHPPTSGEDARFVRELRRTIERMKKSGELALYVLGENFRADDAGTGYLLDRLPCLASEPSFGACDDSLTLVYVT